MGYLIGFRVIDPKGEWTSESKMAIGDLSKVSNLNEGMVESFFNMFCGFSNEKILKSV